MKIAGFDIGGANTDLAVIDFKGDEIKNIEVNFAYLPTSHGSERARTTEAMHSATTPARPVPASRDRRFVDFFVLPLFPHL